MRENREVDGITVALTNLDKPLYPATGTTKGEVIDYFQAIAPLALPHLAGRPITRKRWPNGVERADFFEKRLPLHAPAWIARGSQFHTDGESVYPIADSAATLVWLGQQAALELHVPQWRFVPGTDPDRSVPGPPDRMVLDLDPGPGARLDDCAELALRIRELLAGMGLAAVPVTSGSKGLHVYSTLPPGVSSTGARTVARALAMQLESETPELVTASMAKDRRAGRVFLDWSQNSASKTTVAPYSLRGRERPWVAAPRRWSELERPGLAQLEFAQVLERMADDGDPLAPLRTGAPPATVAPLDAARGAGRAPRDLAPPISLAEHRHRRHWGPKGTTAAEPGGGTAPAGIRPMLPTEDAIGELRGDRWAFEAKWDGYRIVATVRGGRVALRTRSGRTVTGEFPGFGALGTALDRLDAVLDGEAVVLDDAGVPAFHLMKHRARARLLLFDLLELRGVDLTGRPWSVRRRLLEELIPLLDPDGCIEVPALVAADTGVQAIRHAEDHGWEGIVAKRRDSLYLPGERVRGWLKHKRWRDLQVVIGGWRPGTGSRAGRIGSVLVGVPAATGLVYLGRVGSGFTDRDLDELADTVEPLRLRRPPFTAALPEPDARDAVWVLPRIVGDVRYSALRAGGHLRQPTWRGFRPDLLPGDVPGADELPWEGADE